MQTKSKMQSNNKVRELKRLLSNDPINWEGLLELDKELSVIPSPSFRCSFPWLLSKYPPKHIMQEFLYRHHQYLCSDEDVTRECLKSALAHSNEEIIRFIAVHKKFLLSQVLDNSLDIPLHRAGTTEIASIISNAYPKGIGIQNKDGNLPIHEAILHFKSPDQIKFLIDEGKKQHIGTHGGILAKNNRDQTPFSILCYQVATGIDTAYITFPLFRSDLRLWENLNTLLQAYSTNDNGVALHGNFRILHSLISLSCPHQAVYMALVLAPDQIKEADETGRYPISLAASQKSCQRAILTKLLNAYPQAIHAVDRKGRLPLHWATVSGRNLNEGTQELIDADPTVLRLADNDGMFPFMLAATNMETSLDTIYQLLRECPHNL
jgi:ankyrin repeat protein